MTNTQIFKLLMITIPILLLFLAFRYMAQSPTPGTITTFDECVATGYNVLRTYPPKCQTPDGQTFTQSGPGVVPVQMTLSGVTNCLPKKDTGGAVTMECAIGLQVGNDYYALDTSKIQKDVFPVIDTGQEIVVEGLFTPIAMISSNQWITYDIEGIMVVDKIIK